MWNKNEIEGTLDQAKGRSEQAAGALTDNDRLKAAGKVDEAVGKAKVAVGAAQKKVGAAISAINSAVRK